MSQTTLIGRALVRLSGDDVRDFLQGLVTQDVRLVTPETPRYAGLLTPQGKALFDFILWADGADILIDCEADAAEALVRRLSIYRLRRRIDIAVDAGLAVHWAPDGDQGVADPRLAALGRRWIAPADMGADGGGDGGADARWTAHRLALGVPEGAVDLGQDRVLWLETNAAELSGVSFTKGCYVGQENTARMNYRQKVSRRLLRVGGPDGAVFERRRVEAPGDDAFIPDWLAPALAAAG
ncbi:folate-binding protein [Sphingomonas changnyeongensis]|uniref:Folate-binding protein n=1 Tax=Sphingomonas changnyeongensis TaxID=2698679 RepID=A0A7Z2S680_9SPHN|nr:folate-binding protein YgfZ [Sphingomonas changnyeongensis]QHL91213.1 folate-binding protein [Sphingomonas changnyeongensis]